MLRITHFCRRRGELGTSFVPDHMAFDSSYMGPYRGVYKKSEAFSCYETHFNYGSGGCEWIGYGLPLSYFWPETHWIEDRRAERAQAMMELKVDQYRLSVCMDGN